MEVISTIGWGLLGSFLSMFIWVTGNLGIILPLIALFWGISIIEKSRY